MILSNWQGHSTYHRRPIAYYTVSNRQSKPQILKFNDPQSEQVLKLLKTMKFQYQNFGGLGKKIRFDDLEVGKRTYSYNGYRFQQQFYIHQWKTTNDLAKQHPTGTHEVYKNFGDFMKNLKRILEQKNKKTI